MGLLRFILASSVVIWHSSNNVNSLGWLPFNASACVILFFIISGFYMTFVLNEKYKPNQNILFLRNRILRLWPSFIFTTVCIALFIKEDLIKNTYEGTSGVSFFIIILSNISMLGYELKDIAGLNLNGNLGFINLTNRPINNYFFLPQGWSLGLELWFYIIAPFIVRSILKVTCAFILGLIFLVSIKIIGMGEIFVYRSFPSVMTFFMFGSLSYYVGRIIINSLKNNYYIFGFNLILPITLFFLIFPHTLDNFIPEQHKAKFFMIILFIFIPAFFQKTRYSNIDNMIGKLSYPLFIVHPFILFLIEDFYDSLYFPFSALFISSLASLIMVVFIENPINKWKKNKILI